MDPFHILTQVQQDVNNMRSIDTQLTYNITTLWEEFRPIQHKVMDIEGRNLRRDQQLGILQENLDALSEKHEKHNVTLGEFRRNVSSIQNEVAQLPTRLAQEVPQQPSSSTGTTEDLSQIRRTLDSLGMGLIIFYTLFSLI